MSMEINITADIRIHDGVSERLAAQRHAEIVGLLRGLIDSEGDKDKMRELGKQIDAQATALKAAIPAGNQQ